MLSERLKRADFLETFSHCNWTRLLHWGSDHMTQLWRWLSLSKTAFSPWMNPGVCVDGFLSSWTCRQDVFWGAGWVKVCLFFPFVLLSTASSKICTCHFRKSSSHYICYFYDEFGPDVESRCRLTGAQAQHSNSGLMYRQTRKEPKGVGAGEWGWGGGEGGRLLECGFLKAFFF